MELLYMVHPALQEVLGSNTFSVHEGEDALVVTFVKRNGELFQLAMVEDETTIYVDYPDKEVQRAMDMAMFQYAMDRLDVETIKENLGKTGSFYLLKHGRVYFDKGKYFYGEHYIAKSPSNVTYYEVIMQFIDSHHNYVCEFSS